MRITVGKRWDLGAVYIGRPSPLGNPFIMRNQSDEERNRVCDAYEAWFKAQLEENNPAMLDELRRLYKLARQGPLVLGCFCAPKRCHGDTIKQFLCSKLPERKDVQAE